MSHHRIKTLIGSPPGVESFRAAMMVGTAHTEEQTRVFHVPWVATHDDERQVLGLINTTDSVIRQVQLYGVQGGHSLASLPLNVGPRKKVEFELAAFVSLAGLEQHLPRLYIRWRQTTEAVQLVWPVSW